MPSYYSQNIFKLALASPLLCIGIHAKAQEIVLKGQVFLNREPAIGATIQRIGTSQGTISDNKGHFSLKARTGDKIRVSYIGARTQILTVKTGEMRIVLTEDTRMLDEAVVTGYQRVRNRIYTGAASQVKLGDIKLEGVSDLSRMLEGRVAGLSIQNISGSFGAAPRINIRGGASIMGNARPLWVIDGVIYEDLVPLTLEDISSGDALSLISSAVAGLNTNDIQDIQVLKDASATSVYGARALNGVIVVTTKTGARNAALSINYSAEESLRMRPSYDQFDLLNSQESLSVYEEMNHKGYFNLPQMLYGRRGGIYHQMYRDIHTFDENQGTYLLTNTPEARAEYLRDREYANTDWFKHLFRLSPVSNHTLSLSAGSERIATYASLSFYNDPGWSITDKVNRFTSRLRTSFFLSPKLEARLTIEGSLREQKAPGTLPQKKNTTLGSYERDFDINPFSYALGTSRTLRPYSKSGVLEYYRNNWAPFNILNEYNNNYIDLGVLDFKAQTELNYKPNKELEVKALLALRQANTSTSHYIREGSNLVAAWRSAENPYVASENIYLLRDKDNPLLQPQIPLTHGGIYNKTETKLKNYLARLSAEWNRQRGEHDYKLFAFAEMRETKRRVTPFQGYGIQYDRGNQVYTNPLSIRKLSEEGTSYFGLNDRLERGITFSANATYGYKGKYILNTVLNYEGSNISGKHSHNKWLPTWNIGAKWNIDQEKFFDTKVAWSKLALRLSYGLTAKMNEEAINSQAVYINSLIRRFHTADEEHALRILHLENRDLTWEKMYELNIGLEMAWLNNRITATIETYQRQGFDLIDLVRTSGVGGEYYKYANFGDMRTRGIELSLQSKNVETKDFSWVSTLTLSYMSQKITRLLSNPNAFDMVAGRGRGNVLGFPKGSLFSFNFQGLEHRGLPTFDFGLYPISQNADAKISGADFLDAQFAKSYLIYHGPIEPTATAGLANTFRYKGWELSFFITAQGGNKIRLNPSFDPSYMDLNVFSREYYNRWLQAGDELHTDIPTIPSQDLINLLGRENIEKAYNTYNYSQMRVADGSFVRMKNISLGYTLPKSWIRKLGLSYVNIKANMTNPFLIYSDAKLRGQDPEYYKSGGVSLPTPRQYTLTVNFGF